MISWIKLTFLRSDVSWAVTAAQLTDLCHQRSCFDLRKLRWWGGRDGIWSVSPFDKKQRKSMSYRTAKVKPTMSNWWFSWLIMASMYQTILKLWMSSFVLGVRKSISTGPCCSNFLVDANACGDDHEVPTDHAWHNSEADLQHLCYSIAIDFLHVASKHQWQIPLKDDVYNCWCMLVYIHCNLSWYHFLRWFVNPFNHESHSIPWIIPMIACNYLQSSGIVQPYQSHESFNPFSIEFPWLQNIMQWQTQCPPRIFCDCEYVFATSWPGVRPDAGQP